MLAPTIKSPVTFEAADPSLLLRSSTRVGIRGLVFSLLLHGSAVLAFVIGWQPRDFGVVEQPSQAISVELLATSVLEAVSTHETTEAAASAAATATNAGTPDAATPSSTEPTPVPVVTDEPETAKDATTPPVSPLTAEAPPTEQSEVSRERVVAREPPPDEQDVREKEPEHKPERQRETRRPEQREREQRAKPRQAGGVTARGSNGQAAAARASASSGAVLTYAAQVRARVARNKPAGTGRLATVVVAFGVTSSGGLGYARIARSSGDSRLDQASLSAVRGSAPFPPPPAGASAAQLRFSIPFYFN